MLLSSLLSFAPGLLSSLFGNPQAKYRKTVRKAYANLPGDINRKYQSVISSPAYSQAQGAIAQGANQSGNLLQGKLAQAGIGSTGTGAVLSSLLPSLVGSQQAGLRTGAYNTAQEQAMQALQASLGAEKDTMGPSQTQQYFAGGLEALLPYLQSLLKPQMGGGQPPRMGQAGFVWPRA